MTSHKKKYSSEEEHYKELYKLSQIEKEKTKFTALDKNEDGYISISEYLENIQSLGPKESIRGNFKHYKQRNLGILFILSLIKNNKQYINNIACVPLFILCIYKQRFPGMPYYTMQNIIESKKLKCPNNKLFVGGNVDTTLSSIFVFNAPLNNSKFKLFKKPLVLIPPNIKEIINRCQHDKKHMVICHLTISETDYMNPNTHANVLIFDTQKKTMERFDPHGNNQYFDVMFKYDYNYRKFIGIKNESRAKYNQYILDNAIKSKLLEYLPEYTYYGASSVTPYLGPQMKADVYSGLCVTWVTMYILLRLLNPKMNPDEITIKMIDGTPEQLKDRLLRFQGFIINTLRKQEINVMEYFL